MGGARKCLFFTILLAVFHAALSIPSEPTRGQIAKEALRDVSKRSVKTASRLKMNKKYQECEAPGNQKGFCKHFRFCPGQIMHISNPRFFDSFCVIENTYVGICCPEYLTKSLIAAAGSNIIEDLPSGGLDYGEEEATAQQEIIGCGIPAQKGWPWAALLVRNNGKQFCGGALITDKHVLTAAHCFYKTTAKDFFVRLGEHDIRSQTESRSQDFTVAKLTQHEDFDMSNYENDIAILTLNKVTTFNSYIWPICLPPVGEAFANVTATAIGWGALEYNGPQSAVLNEVDITIWDKESCGEAFPQGLSETVLCAGVKEGKKDTCQGDSGGPLAVKLKNGRWVVAGLVSWGVACGTPGRPGIYTKVSSYLGWIFETVFA